MKGETEQEAELADKPARWRGDEDNDMKQPCRSYSQGVRLAGTEDGEELGHLQNNLHQEGKDSAETWQMASTFAPCRAARRLG